MTSEALLEFGRFNHLSGIESIPASKEGLLESNRPSIILLNAGLLRRIGPFRMYVDFARSWSAMGYRVLRFDLSGVGDSAASRDRQNFEKRTVEETVEAMDLLSRRHGDSRFVLMGLCSGARLAHKAALADERVVGNVQLDGYGYRTTGYYLRYFSKRILRPSAWLNFLRRINRAQAVDTAPGYVMPEGLNSDGFPPREQVADEFRQLVRRRVNTLMLFSSEVESYYIYERQFSRSFRDVDFEGLLDVKMFREAAHTFTTSQQRRKLKETIDTWLLARFPG